MSGRLPRRDPGQFSREDVALTLGRLGRPVALATWIGLVGTAVIDPCTIPALHVTGTRAVPRTRRRPSRTRRKRRRLLHLRHGGRRLTNPATRLRLRSSRPARSVIEPGASAVLDALTRGRKRLVIGERALDHGRARGGAFPRRLSPWLTSSRCRIKDIEWLTGARLTSTSRGSLAGHRPLPRGRHVRQQRLSPPQACTSRGRLATSRSSTRGARVTLSWAA